MITATTINQKFTDIVSDYISEGYTFNLNTMSGTQGDLARVDLLDPSHTEVVRVRIYQDTLYEDEYHAYLYVVSVECHEVTSSDVDVISNYRILWNDSNKAIYKKVYYKISRGYVSEKEIFVDSLEEFKRISNIRKERKDRRSTCEDSGRQLDSKYFKIFLPRIKSVAGFASVKLSDIKSIVITTKENERPSIACRIVRSYNKKSTYLYI